MTLNGWWSQTDYVFNMTNSETLNVHSACNMRITVDSELQPPRPSLLKNCEDFRE